MKHRRALRGILSLLLLALGGCLLLWSSQLAQAVREGLSLSCQAVLPALFPFMVLSGFLINSGLAHSFGQTLSPLFRRLFPISPPAVSALLLGALGGYPLGAKTAIQLCQNGECTEMETEYLLAFCNNCGPAFLVGLVGGGIFHSMKAGLLLYLTHLSAALLTGLLLRRCTGSAAPLRLCPDSVDPPLSRAFVSAVLSAAETGLRVTAFLTTFQVLLAMLRLTGILGAFTRLLGQLPLLRGLEAACLEAILTGFWEMASGVQCLSGQNLTAELPLAALILGWGGLSVHCQVLGLMADTALSPRLYFQGKVIQGLLAACLTRFLLAHTPIRLHCLCLLLLISGLSLAAFNFFTRNQKINSGKRRTDGV